MVLLVPDDAEDVTENATEQPSSEQPKAQLDDSEASKATQKVDLDLDDAPFLEDEEEEEIELEEDETPLLQDQKEKTKFDLAVLLKNKLFLISFGVIIILIVVIVVLLTREPEAPPPPPPAKEVQTDKPAEIIEEVNDILIRLDPFLIEQKDLDGQIRFLEVSVVVSTPDDGLARQFKQETYAVRNALYYYLKNKDLQFLSDKDNSDKLKSELLTIINQYMGYGQFKTILFEQYLVR